MHTAKMHKKIREIYKESHILKAGAKTFATELRVMEKHAQNKPLKP